MRSAPPLPVGLPCGPSFWLWRRCAGRTHASWTSSNACNSVLRCRGLPPRGLHPFYGGHHSGFAPIIQQKRLCGDHKSERRREQGCPWCRRRQCCRCYAAAAAGAGAAMWLALLLPFLVATCAAGQSQESGYIVKNIRQALDSTSGGGSSWPPPHLCLACLLLNCRRVRHRVLLHHVRLQCTRCRCWL
jgi:hypothetical protein